jgi:MYXO-CTERM domain-containing protein
MTDENSSMRDFVHVEVSEPSEGSSIAIAALGLVGIAIRRGRRR